MTELYSKEQLASFRAAIKRFAVVAIAVVVSCLAVCTAICFFVDRTNASWLKVINVAISAVGGCVALYLLFNGILPLVARKNFVEPLLFSEHKTLVGVVESVGKEFTISKNIRAKELTVKTQDGCSLLLYWDTAMPFPDLEGKQVAFRTVRNCIVAYEVSE